MKNTNRAHATQGYSDTLTGTFLQEHLEGVRFEFLDTFLVSDYVMNSRANQVDRDGRFHGAVTINADK